MKTYSEKVLQIKVIRDYLVTLLTGILSTPVKITRAQLLNDSDYPMIGVVYADGNSQTIRESGNATLTFYVVYRNRAENELDELTVPAQIAAKFEDTTLNKNCIGCVPHLPQISADSQGETGLIESTIELEIEI